MKKILTKSLIAFVCFICLIANVGCSCAKSASVKYTVTVGKEDNSLFTESLDVKTVIKKKFREPIDTPCYKLEDDEYVLIEDADEVYQCYDKDGNEFEKANYNRDEFAVLAEENPIYRKSSNKPAPNNYESKTQTMPDKYSLVYEITIQNYNIYDESVIYFKLFDESDFFDESVKQELFNEKIFVDIEFENTQIFEQQEYYALNNREKVKITIEFKNLVTSDLSKESEGILTFNIPIVIR